MSLTIPTILTTIHNQQVHLRKSIKIWKINKSSCTEENHTEVTLPISSHTVDHPQEELAKSGYGSENKLMTTL
jgi:hypothetical protein